MERRTFVLVHGGMHGGWCWARVAQRLRAAGHEVFTPTLTGLGERAHLLSPSVDVETHVEDIVAGIVCEELSDVVLVGHSYGGYPVTGAADRVPERLGLVVYLDALVGVDGCATTDLLPADFRAYIEESAVDQDGTLVTPNLPVETFAIADPEDAAWVERRMTPQPAAASTTPLRLSVPAGSRVRCAYIRCTNPVLPPLEQGYRYAVEHGWPVHEVATGHDAMVTAPRETAELLQHLASD